MNTVNDLRLALAAEVTRLQPQAGLETRVLQQALRDGTSAGRATPGARRSRMRRVWRSLESPRVMAIVAAVLALAIIASVVFAARALHLVGFVPSSHGPVGQGQVVTQVDFQCSLPVMVDIYPFTAVQIQLPGGTVSHESIEPTNNPFTGSYDVQVGRWLPVPRSAVSPDGRSWAYGTGMLDLAGQNGTVHVVDAATGKDVQLWSGAGGAAVVGFLPTGVYFVETGPSGPPSSLWVVDPARSGSGRLIGTMPSSGSWDGSSIFGPLGGFAFVRGSNGDPKSVVQIDLSGNVSTWFTSPVGPTPTTFLGMDAQGRPIIATGQANPRVLLLTGPNSSVVIADGSNIAFDPINARGDAHGVWFGERGSIWLYQPGAGLREVFAMPPTLFSQPPVKKLPPNVPSPPPPTPGTPFGAGLTVIGPCT